MAPLAPGTILIAEPPLADPNFRRTVILLCEHTTEGSFGLVLNRPCEFKLAEIATVELPFDTRLGFGGPVQTDTLHFLHPFGDLIDDAQPVADGVWWGGAFESLVSGINGGWLDAARMRFFLGYSGWGEGQLDAEVDEGSWIVLPATEALVFAAGDDALWRSVLRKLGGEYAILSTFPDDPRLN
jgi:putative transcriptional regulator